MLGRVLGYDQSQNSGTISADDGNRYTFTQDVWKESVPPRRDMKVDFVIDGENAKEIYIVKDRQEENNRTWLGLVSVLLTFFLGFIGTFISRLFLAKTTMGSALIASLIHLVITLSLIIPAFGLVIYGIGTVFYMYKNYMLIVNPDNNSYA